MTTELARLARAAGVADSWVDAAGYRHEVTAAVLCNVLTGLGISCSTPSAVRASLARYGEHQRAAPALLTTWIGTPTPLSFALPTPASFRLTYEDGAVVDGEVVDSEGARWLPPVLHSGYHWLEIAGVRLQLAVAPLRACAIADRSPQRDRVWGLELPGGDSAATPIDFSQLGSLARAVAGHGADALAVGRLHGGDRRGLDPARIDPAQTFGAAAVAMARTAVVDAEDPFGILRQLYQNALPRDEGLLREFLRFDREGGTALTTMACFGALADQHGSELSDWPPDLPSADAAAINAYAIDNAEAVGFHRFLQWLAARGRLAAQASARAGGMAIGLIADLDFAVAPASSEAWADPSAFVRSVAAIGGRQGEQGRSGDVSTDLALHPLRLADQAFQPLIGLLRATMQGVGAIRLRQFDRWRRFWMSAADSAGSGAAVDYPFDDVLRLLVLESVRQRCIVMVDALDDLPSAQRDALAQAGVLCSQAFLQRSANQGWLASADWQPGNVAVIGAIAAPSLLDWWHARDIREHITAGRLGELIAARELRQREQDRARLLDHLGIERRRSQIPAITERRDPLRVTEPPKGAGDTVTASLMDAVIDQLGETPAALVLLSLDGLSTDGTESSPTPFDVAAVLHRLDASRLRNQLARLDDARRGRVARSRLTPPAR